MRAKSLLLMSMVAAVLAGCDSGGIDLNVATTDNSVDNSTSNSGGGGTTNPCAFYVDATNTTFRGAFDGTNCTYGSDFVGTSKPLTVNLTIPFISGIHIFQDSLFVGQNVASGVAPAAGTGPTLTIAAGSTLAFSDSADYLLVNRGARINAVGSSTAPITFTGFTDAVTKTAGFQDVQLWGGIVINGNGITNNCTDAQRTTNQCHVVSEGQPSNYGGNNNTESSGTLRYVVVKHPGFEVAPGDELNGITFNAVGSGTVVENVEVYSTYDDGVEFFGGAVNVTNLVALYVRDDAIDFSDGYVGTVKNALVIHAATNSNHCVEGDSIGSGRSGTGVPFDTAPVSNPTIANLTCILSNNDVGTHGDSMGILIRQGARAQIQDSIVFSGFNPAASNECLLLNGSASLALAASGSSTIKSSIVACNQDTGPNDFAVSGTFANTDRADQWVLGANPSVPGNANYSFNTNNVLITDAENANVRILTPGTFFTATQFVNPAAANFNVTSVQAGVRIGAVTQAANWTANWTYGLVLTSGDPRKLWFAP